MKRKIVLISMDEDTPDSHTRDDQLLAAAARLGFMVVTNELVDGRDPTDIRLIDLCSSPRDKDRVMGSGLVTLADVMRLTAYGAWQRLGGTNVPVNETTLQKRGIGSAFKHVCQLMAQMGLAFTDLDPAGFGQYEARDWAVHGLTGRTAGILAHVEVYDLRIFVQLTDEDIAGFYRTGPTYNDQLVSARNRLRAAQSGA